MENFVRIISYLIDNYYIEKYNLSFNLYLFRKEDIFLLCPS